MEGADAAIKLAERIGFLGPTLTLPEVRGGALAQSGRIEEGILEILGNADVSRVATSLGTPVMSLAQAYGMSGRADEGLVLLDRSLLQMAANGARIFESGSQGIAGELMLLRNPADPAGAERRFRIAIEVARAQRAKSWELRATMSLARLLDQRHRRAEARAMLAEIHSWFTEGFETADLKEARALLDQFNSPEIVQA